LVIATIIPIRTTTTIAICSQIQVGGMAIESLLPELSHRSVVISSVMNVFTRIRTPAIALLLGLSGVACLSGVAAARPEVRAHLSSASPLGGVNVFGPGSSSRAADADRIMAAARAVHAKIVRVEVSWRVLEPRGPGQIAAGPLAYTDRIMSDAAAAGIRVIMLVDGTPCWASSAPPNLVRACVPGEASEATRWQPANPADFATFAGFLARRYGNSLTAFEVWNEPDQVNEKYFAGPNKAQNYAALLKAAYPAIKQANPNVSVLAGSLVGSNGVFLRLLYAAGIKGHYDGLAVHFYTLTLASLRAIRAVQLANGDATPLWLDEYGWSNCYPQARVQQEQGCVTSDVQARNITNIFRALRTARYVAADVLYEMQDERGSQFGVLSGRGSRKPSFSALAKVLSSPAGSESPVALSLRRRGRQVVASGSAPVGDFMQLEAVHGRLVYKAMFTLDRFNRYSIALPSALGTRGLRVRVYQEWAGPGRAAQRSV
jgi:hypothetical protein